MTTPTGRPDWVAWARENKACFDIQPLTEVHKGRQVQVGYELSLYAQIPMTLDLPARREKIGELYSTLRDILESVVPTDHPIARAEIEPFRPAAKLRSETGQAPEIELKARIVRRSETFEALPTETRQGLAFIEEGLLAHGVHRGSAGRGAS